MMKECKVKRGRGVKLVFLSLFSLFLFSLIRIRLLLPNVFVHTNWRAARLYLTAFAKESSCTEVANRAGRGSPVVSLYAQRNEILQNF